MEINIPLIDHHCHGVSLASLSSDRFGALLSESYRPPPLGTSAFDKPLGLAIRHLCAPILDLEPGCSPQAYFERRSHLGPERVNSLFLRASGVGSYLVDTGHRSSELTTPEQLAHLSGCPAYEIVRIEAVFESVAERYQDADSILAHFERELTARAAHAVGLKSIISYRVTFAIAQSCPSEAEVRTALGLWLRNSQKRHRYRLDDTVLLRYALWVGASLCRDRQFPLQLHVGFGDPDIIMHACDPTHFMGFLRAMEEWRVPVVLLHNYPFIREAGWLSEVFQNIYFDVGAILNYSGPSAQRIMDEAMELGPFCKHLYSSDAFGLPELHYLGSVQFRRTLQHVLERWVSRRLCSTSDADAIGTAIASGNATRIYNLR